MELYLHPNRKNEGPFLWGGESGGASGGYWFLHGPVPWLTGQNFELRPAGTRPDWLIYRDDGKQMFDASEIQRLSAIGNWGLFLGRAQKRTLSSVQSGKQNEGYVRLGINLDLEATLQQFPVYPLESRHFSGSGEFLQEEVLKGIPVAATPPGSILDWLAVAYPATIRFYVYIRHFVFLQATGPIRTPQDRYRPWSF